MICLCQNFSSFCPSFLVIYPLCFYGITAFSGLCLAVIHYFRKCSVVNRPKNPDFSITQHFFKIPFLQGIKNIHVFQKFNSKYDFLRQTFFHNRYNLVKNKSNQLYNGIVYNLAVYEDESYVVEIGITHNCRCTAAEVRKSQYEPSNAADSLKKGETATTEIGKNGKNRLEIFRFNPGKNQVLFPPKHPYNKVAGAKEVKATVLTIVNKNNAEKLKALRKEKDAEIKAWASSKIKKGEHLSVKGEQFKTPEVRISRSNIDNLLNHISNIDNKNSIKEIQKILKKSKFVESKKLENKNSKNYGSKIARGVVSYNYYQSKWNDMDVEINMEVMKDGYEQPYAILFKK